MRIGKDHLRHDRLGLAVIVDEDHLVAARDLGRIASLRRRATGQRRRQGGDAAAVERRRLWEQRQDGRADAELRLRVGDRRIWQREDRADEQIDALRRVALFRVVVLDLVTVWSACSGARDEPLLVSVDALDDPPQDPVRLAIDRRSERDSATGLEERRRRRRWNRDRRRLLPFAIAAARGLRRPCAGRLGRRRCEWTSWLGVDRWRGQSWRRRSTRGAARRCDGAWRRRRRSLWDRRVACGSRRSGVANRGRQLAPFARFCAGSDPRQQRRHEPAADADTAAAASASARLSASSCETSSIARDIALWRQCRSGPLLTRTGALRLSPARCCRTLLANWRRPSRQWRSR